MKQVLQEQLLNKPKNLEKWDLIAIIKLGDVPQSKYTPVNLPYKMSELAVNDATGEIQVYVTASSPVNLNKFNADYPDAQIIEDSSLTNPEEWRLLAFPTEDVPDEATPLDNYYSARGREIIEIGESK
jgi:hypothetical protein